MRALTVIAAIALAAAGASAQQPPRDRTIVNPTGTATISGVVLSDEAKPVPVRRVRVTLNSPELPLGRTEITNDDGRFTFNGLPAGRYAVGATKDAYLFLNYGAARPGRPGTAIELRHGESRHITMHLTRGSVITGTVAKANGEPAAGVMVLALSMRYVPAAGERRIQPGAAPSTTDDRGVYRIFGLPPGDYVVAATMQRTHVPMGDLQRLTDAEIRRALAEVRETGSMTQRTPGMSTSSRTTKAPPPPEPRPTLTFAPTYYPGTSNPAVAMTVTLGKAEERAGIDISLDSVPTARVGGFVTTSAGSVQGITVGIVPAANTSAMFDGGFRGSAPVQPDGSFSFRAVPPGRFLVMALSTVRPTAPGGTALMLGASTEVVVDGEDIGNVMLSLEPGVTIAGRVKFDGARPPPDLGKFRIALPQNIMTGMAMVRTLPPLQIDASGQFWLNGVAPGVYRMSAAIPGIRTPLGAWWLKSIAMGTAELLDAPLEIRRSANDVVVTFSDRASTVSGTAVDRQQKPASGAYVIVFSADRRTWFHNSRRVGGIRADANGRYTIQNLPPGEYFIVATTDVEPGEWFDPLFLERLAPGAQRFTLGEFEKMAIDPIVRR